MTWFKIDDGFWSHPKTIALSDAAIALWVKAGAYSCQHLTDGHVSDGACKLLAGSDEVARELVAAGLWKRLRDGWKFHDWGEYQETSDAVRARREQAKERMRKARAAKKGTQECSREQHANVRKNFERSSHNPDPTRPDPTTTSYGGSECGAHSSPAEVSPAAKPPANNNRGTRLPDGWEPDNRVIEAMRAERPDIDLRTEHAKFTDYWTAKTGRDATKRDWNATWRNWIRNARATNTTHADPTRSGWDALKTPTDRQIGA